MAEIKQLSRAGWAGILMWAFVSWSVMSSLMKAGGYAISGGLPFLVYVLVYIKMLTIWAREAFDISQPLSTRLWRSIGYAALSGVVANGLLLTILLVMSSSGPGKAVGAILVVEGVKIGFLGVMMPLLHHALRFGAEYWRSVGSEPIVSYAMPLSEESSLLPVAVDNEWKSPAWFPSAAFIIIMLMGAGIYLHGIYTQPRLVPPQNVERKNYLLWDLIAESPRFRSLSAAEQHKIREQYYVDVLVPRVDPADRAELWRQFYLDTISK